MTLYVYIPACPVGWTVGLSTPSDLHFDIQAFYTRSKTLVIIRNQLQWVKSSDVLQSTEEGLRAWEYI